jgi:hypothetical protein
MATKNYNPSKSKKSDKRYNSFLTEYCDYFMNGSQTDENQENKIFAKYGYNKKNILMIVMENSNRKKLIAAEFFKNDPHLVLCHFKKH